MVSPHDDINGCVHFYSRDLSSAKFHHIVDVMDVVVFDDAEDASHAAYDASLLTVMYIVAAYYVAAYVLFEPSVILPAAYGVPFHLGRAFYVFCRKVVVVVRIIVSSQRDPGTFAVHYLTVFYDPPLAPVRADHAVLKSCGRSPCRGGFLHPEAPDSDIVPSCSGRPETLPAYVDLNVFTVRIHALKVRVYHGLIAILILLRVPFIYRIIRIPADIADLSPHTLFKSGSLIHGLIIQIHTARMLIRPGKIPVAIYKRRIRIVVSEQAVIDPCDPDVSGMLFPGGYAFSSRDDRCQRFGAYITNPFILSSGIPRIYILTIDSRGDQHSISGSCDRSSFIYISERSGKTAVTFSLCVYIYVNIHPSFQYRFHSAQTRYDHHIDCTLSSRFRSCFLRKKRLPENIRKPQ